MTAALRKQLRRDIRRLITSIKQSAWKKAHPEAVRRDYLRHKQAYKARAMAWYVAHPRRAKRARARYRRTHKPEQKRLFAAWYRTHKSHVKVQVKKWKEAHPTAVKRSRHRYNTVTHPETALRYAHERRARLRGVPSERFTHREIFDRDRWVCQLCGGRVNPRLKRPHPRSASLDHKVSLDKGGAHTRANVQLAHLGCNLTKGAR